MVSKELPVGGVMSPVILGTTDGGRIRLAFVGELRRRHRKNEKRVGATAVERAIVARQGLDEAADNRGAPVAMEGETQQAPAEEAVAEQQLTEGLQPPEELEQTEQ